MTTNPYETDELLAQYLLFHYGSAREILPWSFGPKDALDYPVRVVTEPLAQLHPRSGFGRALDVGCAVGRSAYTLTQWFDEVIAIDYAQRFIDAATQLRDRGHLDYVFPVEGKITQTATAKIPDDALPERVNFQQGDAMDLPGDLGTFDLVLAANLICRLTHPLAFLSRLPQLLNPGGLLIINTPLSWMDSFTPESHWIGGTPSSPETLPGLKKQLSPDFEFVGATNMPFLIREHGRKYQWSVAQSSRWQRK